MCPASSLCTLVFLSTKRFFTEEDLERCKKKINKKNKGILSCVFFFTE